MHIFICTHDINETGKPLASSRHVNIVFNALKFPIARGTYQCVCACVCFSYVNIVSMSMHITLTHRWRICLSQSMFYIHVLVFTFTCMLSVRSVRSSALAPIILCSRTAVIKFVFVFTSFLFHEKCKQATVLLAYLSFLVGAFFRSLASLQLDLVQTIPWIRSHWSWVRWAREI